MSVDILNKNDDKNHLTQGNLKQEAIDALKQKFLDVRRNSITLASPLSPEDWMLQSMEEASPVKWHLAHTSWFFETFFLQPYCQDYKSYHTDFGFLFNSYYQQIGNMHRRARRGLLSRPTADEVMAYRRHIDEAMVDAFHMADTNLMERLLPLVELGCSHEEQHQELMQTDLLHGFYQNALLPSAYECDNTKGEYCDGVSNPCEWVSFEGGLVEKGADQTGFCFDNETPRHKFYLNPFELTVKPVNNRSYIEFIEDGGYADPQHWLADGWVCVENEGWAKPLYWRKGDDGKWYQFTLFGEQLLNLDAPVRHVSYFEAAAYASWAGVWLPTETEWEVAAACVPVTGNFLVDGKPKPDLVSDTNSGSGLQDMYGSVWEWTQSPYAAYPGFKPVAGAIGEYNGKFMSSQMVLRGGSSATPVGHVRASYRNFFPPNARWQYSGFRLAR